MIGVLTQLAQGGQWDHMHDGDGAWMWTWGALMMLTWVVIVAAIAWLLLRHGRGPVTDRGPEAGSGRARQLLDERLANGEITPDEYRERRALLE